MSRDIYIRCDICGTSHLEMNAHLAGWKQDTMVLGNEKRIEWRWEHLCDSCWEGLKSLISEYVDINKNTGAMP